MGLDNIPNTYPCEKAGTVVRDADNRISCEETQQSGGCPYINEKYRSNTVRNIPSAYGMLGTDCWYRGKFGNAILDVAFNHGLINPLDFYGTKKDDGTEGLSPEQCILLSDWMSDNIEKWTEIASEQWSDNFDDRKYYIEAWMFASWWLKFVANNANGSDVWY